MILGHSDDSDVDLRTYAQNPVAPIEAPWYKGMGTGLIQGITHARAVADIATDADDFDEKMRRVKESRVDPSTVGTAGQLLHGLSSIAAYGVLGAGSGAATGAVIGGGAGAVAGGVGAIPGAAVGAAMGAKAGGVASIGYLSGVDRYFEMIEQGVSHEVAQKAAGITGSVMAISAALPAYIGKTLAKQVTSGVVSNVALGMGERGATGEMLRANDYEKIAEHYRALDVQNVALDAMLGAAFPLAGRMIGGKQVTSEQLDAALVAQQHTLSQTRNPGLESSLENVEAFKANLIEADKQIIGQDRTLDQLDLPRNTADIPNPEYSAMYREWETAIDEHLLRDTGFTREQISSDIRRAVDLDNEVRKSINDRITQEIDAIEQGKPLLDQEGKIAEEMTPDMFAQHEAEVVAKIRPDVEVINSKGERMPIEDISKHITDTIKEGKDDAFLHNVAIACSLTHGDN